MKELIEKYGVSETLRIAGRAIPVLNIPMMTDEEWNRLAEENAVHNFTLYNSREPESVNEAELWQRSFIAELEKAN